MSQAVPDDRGRAASDRPIVITRDQPGPLTRVLQGLIIVLLVAVLGAVLTIMVTITSLLNASGQVVGGVGSNVTAVADQAARAASSVQQAVQAATDPQHPPVGLTYDREFSALQIIHIGEHLPGGTQYVLTLSGIHRRENADSPDTAQYASIHAELRQPRETRLFGQLLHTDPDAHEYATYKGESFRIGRAVYRVNWVSEAESSLAVAAYRSPDAISAPFKFDYP